VTDGFDPALMVQRVAQGEVTAWDPLVEHYAPSVWAVTRQFKLSESDAKAVSQATWLHLLDNIGRLEHPERVGSWLEATARDECQRLLEN
jgi:DNA-directed RNA polymerase specialized sigma24 family protein